MIEFVGIFTKNQWLLNLLSKIFIFLAIHFLLLLLLLFTAITYLTFIFSLLTILFFLPSLGRSKIKGGLPVPSFFKLADHADHVIQVDAGSAFHILSDGQSLGLDSQFLRSHHTGILNHCAVNQPSKDEYIFFLNSVQGFLSVWAEIDQPLMKLLGEDANILFVSSQGPMLISHPLQLRPYSAFEAAKMDARRVSHMLDSLHYQLNLISERFILLLIHFPLVCQIQNHHLTCRHSLSYLFLFLFLLGLNVIQISSSLDFSHCRQHFFKFLEICFFSVLSFFFAILVDLSDQLLDTLFGLLLP